MSRSLKHVPSIERKSVTSRYHGSKISGSQQKGALATMMATAMKTTKKNRFTISKTTNLHLHHAFMTFLSRRCTIATWIFPSSHVRFVEKVNKTQKFSFSFSKLWNSPFQIQPQKILPTFDKIKWNWKDQWSLIGTVRIHFLRDIFGVSSRNSATMATRNNNFSSLLNAPSWTFKIK